MPQGRISKRSVDAFSCPAGRDRVMLWDSDLAGFGLVAFQSGKKAFVCQYRASGKSHRVTLGAYGRLTCEQARSEAKKLLGAIETGSDPIGERKAAREVRAFAQVSSDFMALHVASKRKTRTGEEYSNLLRLHILPALGSKRILDVRKADVARLHSNMVGSPCQANRAVALVSAIWNWAARRDEVAGVDNPAKGIERYPQHGRERYLTSDELARLGDALREGETIGLLYHVDGAKPGAKHAVKARNRRTVLDLHAVAAIRLLILTGARLREVLDAQWQNVDLGRGIMFLPDSKTGRKPIYLSAAAQSVLAALPRIEDNPHIIPGVKTGQPRADLNKPWRAVTRAAGLEAVRLHDIRHTFASVGAGASMGLPVIGKLLGHSQSSTTQKYAHLDADPLRRAVDTIGATLSAAMDGNGRAVAPFKRSNA